MTDNYQIYSLLISNKLVNKYKLTQAVVASFSNQQVTKFKD